MAPNKRAAERAAQGLPEPQRCGARKRDGTPCQRWRLKGGLRCRLHGGASPQAKKAAQERLAGAVDVLMVQLLKIASSAESEAVRLSAVNSALDRAGFSATHLVKLAAVQPWEDLLAGIVDDDLFEDVPTTRRQRRIGPSHSRLGVGPDEDYDQAQRDQDEEEERIELSFDTPGTIRGHVVRDYGTAPTPQRNPLIPPKHIRDGLRLDDSGGSTRADFGS